MKLVCPVNTYENKFQVADFGFEPIPRLEYQYKNTASIPHYENNSQYELVTVKDAKTLTSCNWFSLINSFYSSPDIYLKNGISLILYDTNKNRIASEVHGVIAENMVEIGTITHEDYRDKKLATIVCNKLIHDCIKKGLNPIWTCDKTNIASRKVAENQGMVVKMEYTFHTLKK